MERNDSQKGDEISIDFSKIASWFSRKEQHKDHKKQTGHTKSDDDMTLDLSKVWAFLVRHKLVLLMLIPLVLSTSIRMQGAELPITDTWATDNIYNFIRQDISNALVTQYPNLPDTNRKKLINDQLVQAIDQNQYVIQTGQYRGQTLNIEQEIERSSASIKQMFQYDVNGESYPYMPDIDPYTYLRYAENYLETGQIADEYRNGNPIDNKQMAPLGKGIYHTYHPHVMAYTYNVLRIFNPDITTMQAVGYLPVIVVAFSIILLFLLLYIIGAGHVGALFGTIYFATNSALLGRTIWGHADTDVYNVFFPLLIVTMFSLVYYFKSFRTRAIFLVLTALTTAAYSVFWAGWWYIFDFIIGASGLSLLYVVGLTVYRKRNWSAVRKDKRVRDLATIVVSYFILTAIAFWIITGSPFVLIDAALKQPLGFTQIKAATQTTLWPNVYTTVAELNPGSFGDIVSSTGGTFYFYAALVGALLTLGNKDNKGNRNIKYALLLLLWFFGTIYASTKGIRFTFLLVPAVAVGLGYLAGKFYTFMTGRFSTWFKLPSKAVAAFAIIFLVFLLWIPGSYGEQTLVQKAYRTASHDLPLVNDGWYNTLTAIKADSEEDAIITSWWDFGHHFKYFSGRRVTFDGASQNQPMAHWVGKMFSVDDEQEAIGILRMLDCGSREAFRAINREEPNFHTTARIVNDIITLPRNEAEAYLRDEGFSEYNVSQFLKLTHCIPPEAYVIASGDMIGKSGVWAHFGHWSFERAHAWLLSRSNTPRDEAIQTLIDEASMNRSDAARLYDEALNILSEEDGNSWISPWPSYSQGTIGCSKQADLVVCNNVVYNTSSQTSFVMTPSGEVAPPVFTTLLNNTVVTQRNPESDVPFGVVLVPQGSGYYAVASSPELAPSIFTRAYYFEGKPLEYMDLFKKETGIGGQLIYTYKVNWTKYMNDIGEFDRGEVVGETA